MKKIIWTDYFRYRVKARCFSLESIEDVIRFSAERYYDTVTGRKVIVGKDGKLLIMIPYEENKQYITPVTVHATTRQQILYRVKTGRFEYE